MHPRAAVSGLSQSRAQVQVPLWSVSDGSTGPILRTTQKYQTVQASVGSGSDGPGMSDGERYHSIPERIAWTSGFRLPVDAFVLGKLSMFASFKTGLRARMRLDKLVAQCAPLSRSTVLRALQRLEADGFIKAWRQHRRPTVYDICVERLAPDWRGVKLLNRTTSDFAKPPLS